MNEEIGRILIDGFETGSVIYRVPYLSELKEEYSFKNRSITKAIASLEKINVKFADVLRNRSDNLTIYYKKYPYTYVDFKVHHLEKGQSPCLPGWHLDGYSTAGIGKSERYELIIFDEGTGSMTEFLQVPWGLEPELTVRKNDKKSVSKIMENFRHQLKPHIENGDLRITRARAGHWHYYSDKTFHRGIPASQDGTRVLLRVRYTNRKSYEQRNFTVTKI